MQFMFLDIFCGAFTIYLNENLLNFKCTGISQKKIV